MPVRGITLCIDMEVIVCSNTRQSSPAFLQLNVATGQKVTTQIHLCRYKYVAILPRRMNPNLRTYVARN